MYNINQKFISTNLPKTLEEWVVSERQGTLTHWQACIELNNTCKAT